MMDQGDLGNKRDNYTSYFNVNKFKIVANTLSLLAELVQDISKNFLITGEFFIDFEQLIEN